MNDRNNQQKDKTGNQQKGGQDRQGGFGQQQQQPKPGQPLPTEKDKGGKGSF